MDNFIMLPNKLVWNNKDNKQTYLYKYGDKILHILSYLNGMTNYFKKTVFTIEHMITNCGLKVRKGKDNNNEQFKKILEGLKSEGIIQFGKKDSVNFLDISVTKLISCTFNMPIKIDTNGLNTEFFTISYDNYLRIIDKYAGKLNKLTLLKVYFYINSRLSRRENFAMDGYKIDTKDISIHGGKANCFYDSYANVCKDLWIAEDTWKQYIKELNNIGLLYYDNIGNVRKNGRTHTANNVYCVDKAEINEALKQSELYYSTEKYEIIGKKTSEEIREINGLKGKIKQEENKNKDISTLKEKLEKLETKKGEKFKKVKLEGGIPAKTETQGDTITENDSDSPQGNWGGEEYSEVEWLNKEWENRSELDRLIEDGIPELLA